MDVHAVELRGGARNIKGASERKACKAGLIQWKQQVVL
jgi:hypothetical protein